MKNLRTKIKYLTLTALIFPVFAAADTAAQQPPTAPTAPPVPPVVRRLPRTIVAAPRSMPQPSPGPRADSEKSLAVDPKVYVSMCVRQGSVKVNGWTRDEIRIFVKDGNAVELKGSNNSSRSGKPAVVKILGVNAATRSGSECFSAGDIEIDVPRGANFALKGSETKTSVDSIRKASVRNVGGNIYLRSISEGADASTYEGDVSVENSTGAFVLESLNGNIIAFELSPSEISDGFRAKTSNGTIALQGIEHHQVEVNSISGAISYNGAFTSGGNYSFGTSNGAILLALPPETSCTVNASYGFGGFNSELPITKITENNMPRAQKIVGTLGQGDADATVNLTTSSGAIRLRKQK